jgi:hypothetical protein
MDSERDGNGKTFEALPQAAFPRGAPHPTPRKFVDWGAAIAKNKKYVACGGISYKVAFAPCGPAWFCDMLQTWRGREDLPLATSWRPSCGCNNLSRLRTFTRLFSTAKMALSPSLSAMIYPPLHLGSVLAIKTLALRQPATPSRSAMLLRRNTGDNREISWQLPMNSLRSRTC